MSSAFLPTPAWPFRGGTAYNAVSTTYQSRNFQRRNRNCVAMVSTTPVKEKVKEKQVAVKKKRETKQPNMYRLFIYDDPINRRERVVDVLLKTCQGLTFSRAYSAMQEAHENGRGLVLVIAQEIAEHYCSIINGEGVLSTIEPE